MSDYDEVIEEIRRARCEMSKRFGHDVRKYVKYLKQFNTKYAAQVEQYRALGEPVGLGHGIPYEERPPKKTKAGKWVKAKK